jgi:acyl dehydratase
MPIDIQSVRGAELPEVRWSWSPDDVILYHLGLGAGVPPTEPRELAYTYERGLQVLPSYGVIPAMPALLSMLDHPGMDIDLAKVLHGEQDLELHAVLPASGEVRTTARIAEIHDKGKAALVILETTTSDAASGEALCTNRFKAFIRGEGGFGGDPGSPASTNDPPARAPDQVVECQTMPQQALLYRLSGDKNPMHADPQFARQGGFDQPILHGLCSYGMVCKAVIDTVLEGDVTRVARYQARFAGIVFPGETIKVSIWEDGDQLLLTADCSERDAPVLSNAAITLHARQAR